MIDRDCMIDFAESLGGDCYVRWPALELGKKNDIATCKIIFFTDQS